MGDGGGQRTGQRLVAGEQGRDPSAANQAENLVDGRTRRFKVFLRRLRLRSKEEEALPKSAPLSLSFPSPGSPSKAQTRPDPTPQHSDHSSVKSELSPATEDKNFCIVRLNIRG